MQTGKMNIILDAAWGSSGKGKISTYLADKYNTTKISSSNFPNAGHSVLFPSGFKFVAKAIPTGMALRQEKGMDVYGFISPGSGFHPKQLIKEWEECGKPRLFIHSRASLVTESHAARERDGGESTKHIASTMQGSGTAISDKILRKADVPLAGTEPLADWLASSGISVTEEMLEKISVVDAFEFRNMTHGLLANGETWLHEGSQGYALSIDHGSHYPFCTSRNCTVQAAMDHMAVPPSMVGDVYLNLRTFPIRVGNVVEDGVQKGFSGGFYPDCSELTWEEVARRANMPESEAKILAERERTTVTKRIRRVCTFSFLGLQDAVRVNGATKLSLNFIQYIDWNDNGLKGGKDAFDRLSKASRDFISKVEEAANLPVTLIGTGAGHDEIIDLS